jgi:hypothetical protein
MLLMMLSSVLAEPWMIWPKRRWRSLRSVLSSTSVVPSTPLRGVRISWLTVARNSDFALLAASALVLASSSSLTACHRLALVCTSS